MAVPILDLGFGFNDPSFSDRVLRIELIADSLDSNRKRSRREDSDIENVVEVKTLHISSLHLAGNSPFFHKLLKNGMRESHEKSVTLRINASEDAPLMDMLKFTYSRTLSATSVADLVDVLMVADKFQVTSCVNYCCLLLQKMTMSLESALQYFELPVSILSSEVVQPLLVAAKQYKPEMMDLPLCAVEVVLGSDGLHVHSEDDVYDYILKWARAHYPKLKERREILTERLVKCICFPYMSYSKLKEALVCPDFGREQVTELVLEALFVKVEDPYLGKINASKVDLTTTKNYSSLVRIYKYRPFHVVTFELLPQPRCVVYFDLKKEECENLFPQSERLLSPSFCLGGRSFHLSAKCTPEKKTFGVYVWMTKESESCTIDIEFAAMKKHSKEFENQKRTKCNKSELLEGWGFSNLFETTWSVFMSKDSQYFIDGILHLRADLTIKNIQA